MWEIPFSFETAVYRTHPNNVDLAQLSDEELIQHYHSYGKDEGRFASALNSRSDFTQIIPSSAKALEIGPFANPLLSGDNVSFCDVLSQEELIKRANQIGLDPERIPFIDYKLGNELLDEIDDVFDVILSCHSIEHQPDLVEHLNQIERRLVSGGRYFILIPDKRYCFDRLIAPSSIADIIQANFEKRKTHNVKSIIEHRSLTVHNNNHQHWFDRESPLESNPRAESIQEAIEEFKQADGSYIDVHAWYFTPNSFCQNIELLNDLGMVSLKIERVYHTLHGHNEFWVILKK